MSVKAGWQGALYYLDEGTLGQEGVSPVYRLWPTEESDTLSLNEAPATRRPIYGKAWDQISLYTKATQTPAGVPGSLPMYFSEDGSHLPLMRLFRHHFQYDLKVTGGTNISRLSLPQQASEPSQGWTGYSFVKDWSCGSLTKYTGGAVDVLSISWASSKPCVMIKPTLKFLSGTSAGTYTGTLDTSINRLGLITPGNMTVTLDGSTIDPAGFDITSKRNLLDQMSPSAAGRNGFAMGQYGCDIKLQMWIDDNFFTRYQDTFTVNRVGTLIFTLHGPAGFGTTAHANYGECVITTYVQPSNYAPMALKKGAGIETVSLTAVSPEGASSPMSVQIYTLYSASGI